MYSLSWDKPTEHLVISDTKIILPDMPDEKDMINYNLPIKDQKFQRTRVPADIKNWKSKDIEEFAARQWHRRLNGEWWLIKGMPLYLPGGALTFFDYWTTEDGVKPDFRISNLELMWFWYLFVERDPFLYGLYDMKARRIGDTETLLFILWERTTRYRYAKAGMQSYTDIEAGKAFARAAKGNEGMPFFFKPMRSGSDSESLNFGPPKIVMTKKQIRELDVLSYTTEEGKWLHSYMDYEATVTGKYDSGKLFTYYLDEIFKIKPGTMDAKEQWDNVKKVLSLNNGETIYGKAMISSTVEEKNKRDNANYERTIEIAEYFWEKSNHHERNENGETYTGLARIFRGWQYGAKVDEYGFPKIDQAKKFRQNKLNQYLAAGDFSQVLNLFRKEPDTPEEALTDFSEDCPIHPDLCQMRLNQIKNKLDRYNNPLPANHPPLYVEGELVWKGGIPYTQVEFIHKKGGKWHISEMPRTANLVGRIDTKNGVYVRPLGGAFYSMGCDPYDADKVLGKGSDGAFVVKRSFYPPDEPELIYDEAGSVVNPDKMRTNRIVCDYRYRPKSPFDFYMDVVMTCWFYGVPVFPELDKPTLTSWMRENRLDFFIQFEPKALLAGIGSRNKARQGTKSGEYVISTYVELMVNYYGKYWFLVNHPRLLESNSRFRVVTRTKHDLAVANGYTELAEMDKRSILPKEDTKEEEWGAGLVEYETL